MGNLGKFKKKVKKLNSQDLELTKKGQTILMRLGINYGYLLENKEWEKALAMVQWAEENQDLIALKAIDTFHQMVAQQLNINYHSLPQKKRLSFLLDNPQYAEKFFSTYGSISSTPLLPEEKMDPQRVAELYSEESTKLLGRYLDKVDQSKRS